MKTQLTRWENGHKVPGPEYRKLFRCVYGKTDGELGFPEPQLAVISGTDRFSAEAVSYFRAMLAEHARADNLLGPRLLVCTVRDQAKTLAQAAREARGPLRRSILDVATRYHEFAGWLLQDAGRVDDAMAYTDRARDLAVELGDPLLDTYLIMRKSNIATDAANPALGAALADAALRSCSGLPPRLRATVLRQQANAHAGLGNVRQAQAAIGEAFEAVSTNDPEGLRIASYCTEPYIAMEAGNSWLQLRRPAKALEIFELVKDEWPDSVQRDKGLSLARLARSHAQVGNQELAIDTGRLALALAHTTSSYRTVHELRLLRSDLVGWSRTPEVAQLRGHVAALVASAA